MNRTGSSLLAAGVLIAGLLAAGCQVPEEAPSGPGGSGGPGGGPGRRGGGGGGRGPVPATATAAEIYDQKCQGCHGADGAGKTGPALTGAANEPDADLRKIIHDGHEKMPAFGTQMTVAQLDALVAHVKSLGK